MSDTVLLAIIGLIGQVVLGLLVIYNNKITNDTKLKLEETKLLVDATLSQGKKNEQAIANTNEVIVTLEQNTNSIKDALVKVTAESEFRKGFVIGSGTTDPHASAMAQMESTATDKKVDAAARKET